MPASRLVVLGQGYVGLPLALRAVDVGFDVVGFDVDERRVGALGEGSSYVPDVTPDALLSALATGRYRPSGEPDDCGDFDVAVITVPTPLLSGAPDLSHIEAAGVMLAKYLRPGSTVVLESTTYPGTTDELLVPILESGSGLVAGTDFHVGYSPERIDPGNAAYPFQSVPKVVSGIDADSLAAVSAFYSALVERVVTVSGTREAELTKLLENTFRHVNIALVNELAMFSYDLGIDVWEAIDAASTKPFGFMRFEPGPGVGGHCLPIDPSYLAWSVERSLGKPFRFVELANDINRHMPVYVVERVALGLRRLGLELPQSRVLLLGLAYKRNTGDAREAPALEVATALSAAGCRVEAVDPYVPLDAHDSTLQRVELSAEVVSAADVVVLLTDHDCFDDESVTAHASYVLDTRHRLRGTVVEHL
jgi:UDP-N-acetyl-D-glucosamine dehydrogenase